MALHTDLQHFENDTQRLAVALKAYNDLHDFIKKHHPAVWKDYDRMRTKRMLKILGIKK